MRDTTAESIADEDVIVDAMAVTDITHTYKFRCNYGWRCHSRYPAYVVVDVEKLEVQIALQIPWQAEIALLIQIPFQRKVSLQMPLQMQM